MITRKDHPPHTLMKLSVKWCWNLSVEGYIPLLQIHLCWRSWPQVHSCFPVNSQPQNTHTSHGKVDGMAPVQPRTGHDWNGRTVEPAPDPSDRPGHRSSSSRMPKSLTAVRQSWVVRRAWNHGVLIARLLRSHFLFEATWCHREMVRAQNF